MAKARLSVPAGVALCLGVALAASGIRAAPPTGAGVAVEYVHPYITLRVTGPTGLGAVLEAICQHTEARCEVAPSTSEVLVQPMVTTGTWADVVTKLLEGAKLNYAALAPAPGRAGRLVVEARSSSGSAAPDLSERTLRSAGGTETLEPDPAASFRGPSLTDEEIRELRARQAAPQPPASPPLPSTLLSGVDPARVAVLTNQATEEPGPSPQQRLAAEAAVWNMILGRTPNPPTAPPGMTVLPVPDQNGNPIVVPATTQGPTALPFPDAHGRPIPMLPMPPPTPGQPPPNPFGPPSPAPR